MKNIKACLSHNSDDWKTPKKLYDPLMELNFIDCFPYQSTENELEKSYYCKKLFINPPFSKLKSITNWIKQQIYNKNLVVLLIPARTDTTFFHNLLKNNPVIWFIKGRLHFNESKSAPFPTLLMLFPIEKYPLQNYLYGTIEEFIDFAECMR